MESNLINIKLIKTPRNPKEKYLFPSYKLSITNLDNFLTEKIISKKISLKNLLYKTIIYDLGDFQKIIKSNFLPKFFLSESFLEEKYIPGKEEIITEFKKNELLQNNNLKIIYYN